MGVREQSSSLTPNAFGFPQRQNLQTAEIAAQEKTVWIQLSDVANNISMWNYYRLKQLACDQ